MNKVSQLVSQWLGQYSYMAQACFLMVLMMPAAVIGAGTTAESVSTGITQEEYKNMDTQKIREFIQKKNLSKILIEIDFYHDENEDHEEFGAVHDSLVNAKFQRVLDTLQGINYSITEELGELDSAVLEISIKGFEILANNPEVDAISSPTLFQHYDELSPIRIPEDVFGPPEDPNKHILLPPPGSNRHDILEAWRQKVVSKLDAGIKTVAVIVVLRVPKELKDVSTWPIEAQKNMAQLSKWQIEEFQKSFTKMDVIKDFYNTLNGTNHTRQGSYLGSPVTLDLGVVAASLDIDESAIDRIISNEHVINALVR